MFRLCAQRRVVERTVTVSWLSSGCVAARTSRVAGRVAGPPVMIQKSYRNSIPAAHHVVELLHRLAGRCCAVSQPLARCVAMPGLPSCHDTNDCIVTHLSSQAMRARARSQQCRARGWPYRCRVLPSHARHCAPVLRYNMLYRDQEWEMGSAHPAACNLIFFFSFIIFFLCSSYCKTTKKKKK